VSTRGPSPRLARGDQRLAGPFSATRGRFTAHAMLQRAGHSSIRFARSRRRQPTLPALLCPLLLSLRSAGQLACVASLFIYLSSSLRTADYSMRLSCRAASELGRCDVLDGLRRNTYSKGSSLNRCNLSAKSSAASTELLSKALRCSEGARVVKPRLFAVFRWKSKPSTRGQQIRQSVRWTANSECFCRRASGTIRASRCLPSAAPDRCNTAQHSTAQHSTAQHSTAQHSTTQTASTAQHSQHSTAKQSQHSAMIRACFETCERMLFTSTFIIINY
jgi:hypothetical protein